MRYILLIFTTVFLHPFNAGAQKVKPAMKNALEDARTPGQIMARMDDYFQSKKESGDVEFESEELKWARRAWNISNHLGPDGEFVNVQKYNWKASKRIDEMVAADARTLNSDWVSDGPHASVTPGDAGFNGLGRVDRIAFHPTDVQTIYLGAPVGGLWKTENGGETWYNLTDNIPSTAVSGIVVCYDDPDIIYILTGDGDSGEGGSASGRLLHGLGYVQASVGVLKSTDGGWTWQETGNMPGADSTMVGFQLAQDPINPERLLAATSAGLYRTEDGGESWQRESSIYTYDVKFHPTDSTYAYASRVNGVVAYSDNNGRDWMVAKDFGVNERISLAVTPAASDRVYALVGGSPVDSTFGGLHKATVPDMEFLLRSESPNILGTEPDGADGSSLSKYTQAISITSFSTSHVAVGGFTMWTSDDSGFEWDNCTVYREGDTTSSGLPYIHPDVHDVKYHPITDDLYVATDGGIYRSQDFGETWEDLTENGVRTTMFYHYKTWPASTFKSMGGSQDNGIKYRSSSSTTWDHITGADGFDIAFNPLNGEPLCGTANKSIMWFGENGEYAEGIEEPSNNWFMTIAVHNTMPDTLFMGDSIIWRSFDKGVTWDSTSLEASGSWAMASCPTNNNRFYAAGGANYKFSNAQNSGLYITSDIGDTWEEISTNPGFPTSWSKITDIAVSPIASSFVMVTFGGYKAGEKVFVSNDAGLHWSNFTANLPNVPVYCITMDQNLNIFVGTEIGVFYRAPGMNNWMPWSNGLPKVPITGISIQGDHVKCGTFGRGAWRSDMPDGCIATLQLFIDQVGTMHHEVSDWIRSTAKVTGGAGTYVSMKAGNYIEFYPGVEVQSGNTLNASLGPCGQGGIPLIWQPGENAASRSEDYDVTHAYPLGWINSAGVGHDALEVKFNVKKKGNIEFKLSGRGHETTVYSSSCGIGLQTADIDLAEVDDGFYLLVMYHEGRVAHFQEVVIDRDQ